MKKLLLSCAMLLCAPSYAALYFDINVLSAPYGGYHLITNWGDYFVKIDGSQVWIGNEEEYNHEHVVAASRANGFREFTRNSFVSTGLPYAQVGNIGLASIWTEILFGAPADKKMHRPPKAAGTEYISIVWQQSVHAQIQAQILNSKHGRVAKPYRCFSNSDFHVCEFLMDENSLADKGAILFLAKGIKPAVVPFESLAQSHYAMLADKYRPTMGSRFAISNEDRAVLARLHSIDVEIPDDIPLPPGTTEIH